MWIAASLETVKTPTVIALGNFDGVHRGHQKVIAPIVEAAERFLTDSLCGVPEPGNSSPNPLPIATVVTFHPHPQAYFTGEHRLLLTPIQEKAQYLQTLGIQQLVLLPFNAALAELSPQEFVEQILVQRLQVRQISVGQDFRFGRQRAGTVDYLQEIAARYGIPVEVASLNLHQGERISSSAIRAALSQGELERANELLGRAYTLVGQVMAGKQLGRTIGFPTANLQLPEDKFLPRSGVYAVWVKSALFDRQLGVMNLGYRPTVDGQQLTAEVHLLDWSGDLYGQALSVSLEHFLRPEQKFAGLDQLKAQIQCDCEQARSLLTVSQTV